MKCVKGNIDGFGEVCDVHTAVVGVELPVYVLRENCGKYLWAGFHENDQKDRL
jgi:hypothetical protein